MQANIDSLKLSDARAREIQLESDYIKVGQNDQATRRIFCNQQYDYYEIEQINQFKDLLAENDISYNSQSQNDAVLLRFLYANQFNQSNTFQQFQNHLFWLAQPDCLTLQNTAQEILMTKAIFIMGRDKFYRPALIMKAEQLQAFSLIDINKALLYQMTMIEDVMFYPGKVESWVVLVDCNQVKKVMQPLDQIKNVITNLQTNFPCCLDAIYIIQPPKWIKDFLPSFTAMISPQTSKKIKIIEDLKLLSKLFDVNSLNKLIGVNSPNQQIPHKNENRSLHFNCDLVIQQQYPLKSMEVPDNRQHKKSNSTINLDSSKPPNYCQKCQINHNIQAKQTNLQDSHQIGGNLQYLFKISDGCPICIQLSKKLSDSNNQYPQVNSQHQNINYQRPSNNNNYNQQPINYQQFNPQSSSNNYQRTTYDQQSSQYQPTDNNQRSSNNSFQPINIDQRSYYNNSQRPSFEPNYSSQISNDDHEFQRQLRQQQIPDQQYDTNYAPQNGNQNLGLNQIDDMIDHYQWQRYGENVYIPTRYNDNDFQTYVPKVVVHPPQEVPHTYTAQETTFRDSDNYQVKSGVFAPQQYQERASDNRRQTEPYQNRDSIDLKSQNYEACQIF